MQTHNFNFDCRTVVVAAALLWPVLTLGAPQVPPSAPVTVVNQPANPVPVTGSVTVVNQPSNPVTVLIDDTVLTRNIDAPGTQPIILTCNANSDSCSTNFVPSGKRMVVQMISANLSGDNLNGSVTPLLNAVRVQQSSSGRTDGVFDLFVPLASVGIVNSYYPFWIGNQRVSIYLDEGKGIFGNTVVTTTGTSRPTLSIFAYGYLVDKQ